MEIDKRLDEIVDLAYKLLIQKLSNGGIKSKNEASLQLEFAYILKTLGELHEFNKEDIFYLELERPISLDETNDRNNYPNARVDIFIDYTVGGEPIKATIEMKYLRREGGAQTESRYDVFTDLSKLEKYQQKKGSDINLGYFILVTDDLHYVRKEGNYGLVAKDFDFRDGEKYSAKKILEYHTTRPDFPPICLSNDYNFKWDFVDNQEFYFLKVKVDCKNIAETK